MLGLGAEFQYTSNFYHRSWVTKGAVIGGRDGFGICLFEVTAVVGHNTIPALVEGTSFAAVSDDAVGNDGPAEWQICKDAQGGLPW